MRRAERLFQLIQLIRGRRLSTARFLAERLQVSERTVYRDVAELRHAFRSFRVDRIGELEVLDEVFVLESGKTLADLFRVVESRSDDRDRKTV